jgi:hypothetical protein
VHEAVVAGVDADVANLSPGEPEENQVPRSKFPTFHGRGLHELLGCRARHGDADLPVRIGDEPAAVQGVRAGAAVLVGCADA